MSVRRPFSPPLHSAARYTRKHLHAGQRAAPPNHAEWADAKRVRSISTVRSVRSEPLVQSVASELDDDELDRMIEALRQRVLEAREERALDQALQMKLLGASKHDCQRLVPGRRGLPNCALPASPLGDSGRL